MKFWFIDVDSPKAESLRRAQRIKTQEQMDHEISRIDIEAYLFTSAFHC